MPRSFTFATIAEYQAAKRNSGAIYAELVSSGIKSGSCVSKITATGDVFIDSINPFVTPELGQEGDTLYYNSSEDTYRFLRAGNTTWDADSYGQVYIDLAKIPSGFSVVAPYTDIFNFKQTDENIGSGKASMTKILGNTVAWNSLVKNGNFASVASWLNYNVSYSVSGNVATIVCSDSNSSLYQLVTGCVSGHKYYVRGTIKGGGTNYAVARLEAGGSGNFVAPTNSTSFVSGSKVFSASNTVIQITIGASNSTTGTIYARDIYLVDLTLLYGSAIDGLTDAQILAKFESEFPGYHSYNAGTLISNKAKAIEFVGFNQWDEEWEEGSYDNDTGQKITASGVGCIRCKNPIKVIPNTEYYINKAGAGYVYGVFFYDINGQFLSPITYVTNSFTTPSQCYYITFRNYAAYGTTYHNDICINLSGKRNGQYEPYKKVVLPLPNLDQIKVYSHNLYDPATGKAKVEGGKQYYIGGTYTSISQNGTAITVSSHLFTPSASGNVDVVGGNSTDTIINLSSSFNGQYEPHGILTKFLKGKGSWADEYAGKYYEKAGRVDLGSLQFIYNSTYSLFICDGGIPLAKRPDGANDVPNLVSTKYPPTSDNTILDKDKQINIQTNITNLIRLRIKDSGMDGSNIGSDGKIAALSGSMLDYELATPIEYEIYSPTKMPFNWKYRVSEYHTKKMLPENGEEPTSAPFACEIKQI